MNSLKEEILTKIKADTYLDDKYFQPMYDGMAFENDDFQQSYEHHEKQQKDILKSQLAKTQNDLERFNVSKRYGGSFARVFLDVDAQQIGGGSKASFSENEGDVCYNKMLDRTMGSLKKIYSKYGASSDSWRCYNDSTIEKQISTLTHAINNISQIANGQESKASFSENLPLNVAGEVNAMDAVSVASWHDTHERYVKELDMYQLDLFYGADSAHKYFTIDDAIDRRQMLPDNRRALVFEVVEKQIPMNGDMDLTQDVVAPYYEMPNFRNITNNSIKKTVPVFHAYWGYRYSANEEAFARGIAPLSPEETIEEQLRMSVSAFATHMAENEFIVNLPAIRVSKKNKTVAISSITNNDVEIIKIGIEQQTLSVNDYPTEASLPKTIKLLKACGFINGVCTLKTLLPSTADADNVWCIGVEAVDNYVVALNSMSDIADNQVLSNTFLKAIFSVYAYSNPDFDIGCSMKPFGKMMICMDKDQAWDLCRNDATGVIPFTNNIYSGMRTPMTRLMQANTAFESYANDIEFHVVSFLPDNISFRKQWANKAWLTKDMADYLNYLFPSNQRNHYAMIYFKNLYSQRYALGEINIDVGNSTINNKNGITKLASVEEFHTPVFNIYQQPEEYSKTMPVAFLIWSE